MPAANAISSADIDAAVTLIEANSQERADALGGERSASTDLVVGVRRDSQTGLSFSSSAAAKESSLRQELATGNTLVAGGEKLGIETGNISTTLIGSEPTGTNTIKVTVREDAEYPYIDEPIESAMGESYERVVEMEKINSGWRVLENTVPEGPWPLVEGAGELGVNTDPDAQSQPVEGTEPAETDSLDLGSTRGATKASRSAAATYALRHARSFSYNRDYRRMRQDCTNFVSQALRAGGFKNRNVGNNRSYWAWWYNSYRIDEWSHSWSVAHYNYRFHQTTKRGKVVPGWGSVTVGDLIYADFNIDGKQDHAVIFSGDSSSKGLKVSMHTSDRRNVDASWWVSKAKKDYSSADFDLFHLNYGTF